MASSRNFDFKEVDSELSGMIGFLLERIGEHELTIRENDILSSVIKSQLNTLRDYLSISPKYSNLKEEIEKQHAKKGDINPLLLKLEVLKEDLRKAIELEKKLTESINQYVEDRKNLADKKRAYKPAPKESPRTDEDPGDMTGDPTGAKDFELFLEGSGLGKILLKYSYLRSAAQKGYPKAEYHYGALLLSLKNSLLNPYSQSDTILLALLNDGHLPEQGEMWMRKAANDGDGSAQLRLAETLQKDKPEEAKEWKKQACSTNDPDVLYELGNFYKDGNPKLDIAKDLNQALDYYKKATRFKNKTAAYAAHAIAEMYAEGKGVEQNSLEAFKWWRRAARYDNSGLFASFASRHYKKLKDTEKEVAFLCQSVEKDHRDLYNLKQILESYSREYYAYKFLSDRLIFRASVIIILAKIKAETSEEKTFSTAPNEPPQAFINLARRNLDFFLACLDKVMPKQHQRLIIESIRIKEPALASTINIRLNEFRHKAEEALHASFSPSEIYSHRSVISEIINYSPSTSHYPIEQKEYLKEYLHALKFQSKVFQNAKAVTPAEEKCFTRLSEEITSQLTELEEDDDIYTPKIQQLLNLIEAMKQELIKQGQSNSFFSRTFDEAAYVLPRELRNLTSSSAVCLPSESISTNLTDSSTGLSSSVSLSAISTSSSSSSSSKLFPPPSTNTQVVAPHHDSKEPKEENKTEIDSSLLNKRQN